MIIVRKKLLLEVTILNMNYLLLYGIKYSYPIRIIFKQIYFTDKTLTGTTPFGQSGPGSNINEGTLHTPQISRIGALLIDVV